MVARKADVLLGPQPPDQAHEFLGAAVAVRLVAFAVAIGGEVVLARDDVDAHASATEVIQRRCGGREVRGPPIAGPDRDQRLERGGPRRERGPHGEGVRPAPAGADQRAPPAVLLERRGVAGQGLKRVVVGRGRIAAMSGADLIGDVPQELGSIAHTTGPAFYVMGAPPYQL